MSRHSQVFVVVAALFVGASAWAANVVPTASTMAFLGEPSSGRRAAMRGERLIALYGTVLASDAVPGDHETTDDFVGWWLFDAEDGNKDALGIDDVSLEFIEKFNIRDDKFTIYEYRQTIEGLPVHGSSVTILVRLEATVEKITYVGMYLTPHPESALPTDVFSAEDAIEIVSTSDEHNHLTGFDSDEDAEKVIFVASDGALHRVWTFAGWSDEEAWQFFVDTASEAIVGVEPRMAGSTRTFTIKGSVELCCHPGRPDWPACCPSGESDCCCEETDPNYPKCAEECCGHVTGRVKTVPLPDVELTYLFSVLWLGL